MDLRFTRRQKFNLQDPAALGAAFLGGTVAQAGSAAGAIVLFGLALFLELVNVKHLKPKATANKKGVPVLDKPLEEN